MAKQISGERKAAYYIGMVMMVLGALVFFSVFVTAAMNFGDFGNFDSQVKSSMFRAIGGMGLLLAGGVIKSIGARGLAGSGVVLDPKQAREELEPYSRMAGGMVKDALDEADVALGGPGQAPGQVIMIRCRDCGTLNEEGSKFCQECGTQI